MITLENWAYIRRQVAEGVPKKAIAAELGISRTTVTKLAKMTEPPRYERTPTAVSFATVEPRVRALLSEFPEIPASVLAERVGWTGSSSWFRENIARIRVDYARLDPADRLTWEPGDAAQCDLWFPASKIPLEDGTLASPPVLVITLAHSRFMLAKMIPSRTTEDLLLGIWALLSEVGRVPRRLIWDNEGGIGRGRRPARGVEAFMGTLATQLVLLPPRDPESKGVVERRNGYFETSFLPGRTFSSPQDFNDQLHSWLGLANTRIVRTLRSRPSDLLEADRALMMPLPPQPLHLGHHHRVRLGRDYYVRLASNDYSADPRMIGRLVDVHADLKQVRIRHQGQLIGEHPRHFARGMTITDSAHVTRAAELRRAFQSPRDRRSDDGLTRDLADYDRAFGIAGL